MTTANTSQYSPFQQELLNHLGQISTNVNTLIEVFVNLQSSLLQTHPSYQPNPSQLSPTNTNIPSPTHSHIKHKLNDTNKEKEKENEIENTSNTLNTKNTNNTNNNDKKEDKCKVLITNESNDRINNNMEEGKDEKKNDEDEDDEVVLSLDSSDTDDETNDNINNSNKPNANNNHLPFMHHHHHKYKGYNNSNTSWKHRSKFGLNRSKSTSSPSASMSTLLRANHIRNHKYNGILKNKYKKKSTYDQKSDSVVNTKKNKSNKSNKSNVNGPVFNPEHVFLSKNNRIIINVGGSLYETTLNTLSADQSSMLSAMFSGRFNIERDENGSIFIDRDPTHFRHVLNFLRDGIEYLKHGGLLQQPDAIVNELLQEAKYYNIRPLVDYIQLQQTRKNKKKGDELTHEKQYKLVTNIGIDELEDVFNKYTGSAGYDFEEWLFVSPYKTSRNSTSSPTFIMLFSKKLSRAEVRLLDRLTNIDFQ